jgi:nucleoside-diphosphate-sugar epimerase
MPIKNNWKSKKIFITGGNGFLGKAIIKMLLQQTDLGEIISVGRSPQPELKKIGVTTVVADICDKKKIIEFSKGSDIIFHTAAKASIWGKYNDFYNTNVIGTENIIEACKVNNIPIVVYTSSPSVISSKNNIINGDETISYPKKYYSHYAKTKAIAESIIINAADKILKSVSLRPHLIWGPGDPHILPRIIEKASKNKLIRIGDKKNIVDLTYISNAAYAHIKAAESLMDSYKISGKTYFISDDAPIILWEWIDNFLEQLGIPKVKKSLSINNAKRLGGIFENIYTLLQKKNEPPITRFAAMQLGLSHFFDISAAKKDFSYHPIISNDDAIKTTIAYFAQNQQ